jgi:MFS family permease
MLAVLKTRDYRLLWIGQGISHLGDQFHLIALPWLVLTITHDPLQLGLVLALAGIPRAVLMLVGGAFADRHSPRTIMLVSDAGRFVIVGALAVAVLTGMAQLWMVYVLAVTFGIVSGFFLPAAQAALPRLLERDHLEGGNALMMGADQLMTFVGPAAAGTVIALFSVSKVAAAAALVGVGIALAVDAVSFAISAGCLAFMRSLPALLAGEGQHPLAAVAEGLKFTMSRPSFRWMLGLVAAANMAIAGPMAVGVPVLAQTRFPEGAAALGIIMSGYGIGNLAGMIGAGSLPKVSDRTFSMLVVALFVGFAAVVTSLGFITSTWLAAGLMVVLGLGNGYIAVSLISTLQRMTPETMLGRVMSLMMLSMVGLVPVSQAVAGVAVKAGPVVLFGGAGAILMATAIAAAAGRRSWSLETLAASGAGGEAGVPEAV